MTQKKKVILRVSAVAATAVLIFAGQYMANRVEADRAATSQAAKQAAEQAQKDAAAKAEAEKKASSSTPPIETEYVYDDAGNVSIAPDTPAQKADTGSSVPESTAKQPTSSTAADKATTNTGGNKNTSSAGGSSSAKSGSSTPAATPKTTTSQPAETGKSGSTGGAAAPSSNAGSGGKSSGGQATDSGSSGKKTVYVEGFGEIEYEGENTWIQGEDQGGDYNKMVGY